MAKNLNKCLKNAVTSKTNSLVGVNQSVEFDPDEIVVIFITSITFNNRL